MIDQINFTTARNTFTSVIDRVQNLQPVAIHPRKASEETTFLLKEVLLNALVEGYRFDLKLLDNEPGSYSYWLEPIEVWGQGETREAALDDLVSYAMNYAEMYLENPSAYFNAPNCRKHLPYILKISLCADAEDVKRLITQNAAEI